MSLRYKRTIEYICTAFVSFRSDFLSRVCFRNRTWLFSVFYLQTCEGIYDSHYINYPPTVPCQIVGTGIASQRHKINCGSQFKCTETAFTLAPYKNSPVLKNILMKELILHSVCLVKVVMSRESKQGTSSLIMIREYMVRIQMRPGFVPLTYSFS